MRLLAGLRAFSTVSISSGAQIPARNEVAPGIGVCMNPVLASFRQHSAPLVPSKRFIILTVACRAINRILSLIELSLMIAHVTLMWDQFRGGWVR